jgi:hypothetical protein
MMIGDYLSSFKIKFARHTGKIQEKLDITAKNEL